MTTPTVSAGYTTYGATARNDPMKQSLKNFRHLADSLKSGDLGGARKAFEALEQSLQNAGQTRDGQQGGSSTAQGTALQQLGAALDAGDLEGAQRLFENLMRGGSESAAGSQTRSAKAAGYSTTNEIPAAGRKLDVIV